MGREQGEGWYLTISLARNVAEGEGNTNWLPGSLVLLSPYAMEVSKREKTKLGHFSILLCYFKVMAAWATWRDLIPMNF